MLTEEQVNTISDIVIEHLDQSEVKSIPEGIIYDLYGCNSINLSIIIEEVLLPLENEGYIKRATELFVSAKLTSEGTKIKRNGGWKKFLQEIELEKQKSKDHENAQIENLKWSTILSKLQVRWFKLSLFVGFIGGICGLAALFLQIKESYFPPENKDGNIKTENIIQPVFQENTSDSLVTNVIGTLKK